MLTTRAVPSALVFLLTIPSTVVLAVPTATQTRWYGNGTNPTSTGAWLLPTQGPVCTANCGASFPDYTRIYWLSLDFTTTITAATVVTIINTRTNATRKSTIFNDLPAGSTFTQPDVNAAGTQVTTITTTDYFAVNYTTVLAFPTEFLDYTNSYRWSGVLATATEGNGPCTSVDDHYARLPSHVPAPSPPVVYPNDGDPAGLNFKPIWDELFAADTFFRDSFPDVPAFHVCHLADGAGPPLVWPTASYLTETAVSYEGNDPATAGGAVPAGAPVVPPTAEASPTPAGNPDVPIIAPAVSIPPVQVQPIKPSTVPVSTVAVPAAAGGPSVAIPAVVGGIPAALPGAITPLPNIPVTIGTLNGQTQTIVVGSRSAALPGPIVLGSQTYTANSVTQYVIEGQTLAVGSPITVGSRSATAVLQLQATSDAASPGGRTQVIVGSSSTVVQPNGAPIVIGDQTYRVNSATQYVIGGHTLGIGTPITVGSGASEAVLLLQTATQAGAAAGQTQVVIGSSSTIVQANGAPVVAGDQTYSANSASQYVVSGQTLALGSPITVGSGSSETVIALQATATDGASLSPLPTLVVLGSSSTALLPSGTPLVIGDQTYRTNSATQYIIEGQTLGLGSTITLGTGPSKTMIDLQTATDGATQVIFGSAVQTIGPSPTPAAPGLAPPVLTIGDHTYTANAATQYVVAPGLTLTPGGSVVTLGGTPISLGPSASVVVVGSSTETLAAPPRTDVSGGAASGGAATATAAGAAPYTGSTGLRLYGMALLSTAMAGLVLRL
ncbi:MAG: hypothetical protein M1826_002250 [Phylliscum demangeonii]|nr:MAG: hypothetical protein M1826_002250 [Phylliscum demangeonii]